MHTHTSNRIEPGHSAGGTHQDQQSIPLTVPDSEAFGPNVEASLPATSAKNSAHAAASEGTAVVPDAAAMALSRDYPLLTQSEVAALRTAGLTDDQIAILASNRASKSFTKKAAQPDLAALFAAKKDWLLERSANKPLFSGRAAGTLLIRAGFYPPKRGFNAMGDKLGAKGHQLPSVVIGNVRHYDASFIGKSTAEKDARQGELDMMGVDVLRSLVAIIDEKATEDVG